MKVSDTDSIMLDLEEYTSDTNALPAISSEFMDADWTQEDGVRAGPVRGRNVSPGRPPVSNALMSSALMCLAQSIPRTRVVQLCRIN